MIFRNRQAIFWALMFPLIFVTVFGLFRLDEPPPIELLIIDNADDEVSSSMIESFQSISNVEVQRWDASLKQAKDKLGKGDVQYLLVIPELLVERALGSDGKNPVQLELFYDRSKQGD